MTKIVLEINNALCQIEMLAERAGIMINDLEQGYFGQNIKGKGDAWKIAPPFYDTARVKTDIANSIIYDLQNQLKELRALLDEEQEKDKEGAAV